MRPEVIELAADAEPALDVRSVLAERLAVHVDLSVGRFVDARQHGHRRRLSRPVLRVMAQMRASRSEDGEHLVRLHLHVQFLHRRARVEQHRGVGEDDAVVLFALHRVLLAVVDASVPQTPLALLLDLHDGSRAPEVGGEHEAALLVVSVAIEEVPRVAEEKQVSVQQAEDGGRAATVKRAKKSNWVPSKTAPLSTSFHVKTG